MSWEEVIGLEVHVQLATPTKLFCDCRLAFDAEPNSLVCPVCLGYPGALPVLNRSALQSAVRAALAFGARIARRTRFDRKNYFYPDLPKGYQISQHEWPFALGGEIEFEREDGTVARLELERIHLEEDAGKSKHSADRDVTQIDLNRCGTPLIEIVTRPHLRAAADVAACLRAIRELVRWVGVSDGNMEEGSLRCDVNLSLRPAGASAYGTRVEIKNLNSFQHAMDAIAFEHVRQEKMLESGLHVEQETRLWNVDGRRTESMRSKEDAQDYRYFPEPDLPEYEIADAWVEKERAWVRDLPIARRRSYESELALSAADARALTSTRANADYFDALRAHGASPRAALNWLKTDIARELNERQLELAQLPLAPSELARIIAAVEAGAVNLTIARSVLRAALETGQAVAELLAARGEQISDDGQLLALVNEVIASEPAAVTKLVAGDAKPMGALVGSVMRRTGGQANAKRVSELLRRRIAELRNEGAGATEDAEGGATK
ncbi:MAG: Asp-tRNA(Asn)/Glu-tRNA(Gln) amidotransferase subunit GatB [Planctomycetota bacterium]